MSGTDDFDDDLHGGEPSAIGVGMGGSCPVCRAPVDLGQEFCLECGSPIRFTPRQRRGDRRGMGRAGAAAPAPAALRPAPPKGGFPWVPFLVVLALIGGGVAFALVDGDGGSDRRSGGDETEPALPTITNSVPETTSLTETTTVGSCDEVAGLEDTVPAVGDAGSDEPPLDDGSGFGDEQIPELSDGSTPDIGGGFDDPQASDAGSDQAGSGETVTVDQDGTLCADGAGSADPATDPALDPGTDPAPAGGSTAASGDWPAGQEGWTVIVAGYDTGNAQERAAQAAADLQERGFEDGGVLFSSDFKSLCPGFHVVFSGHFDTRAAALERVAELRSKAGYAGIYEREITASGPAPSCTTAR